MSSISYGWTYRRERGHGTESKLNVLSKAAALSSMRNLTVGRHSAHRPTVVGVIAFPAPQDRPGHYHAGAQTIPVNIERLQTEGARLRYAVCGAVVASPHAADRKAWFAQPLPQLATCGYSFRREDASRFDRGTGRSGS